MSEEQKSQAAKLQPLIDRVNRVMRDRGDLSLLLAVDRLMDLDADPQRMGGFAAIMQQIQATKAGAKKEAA